MDIEPDWVHLSEDANGIAMNTYFAEHPEMIVGTMKIVSGPYGMESTCQPDVTRPFAEQLREAVSRIDGEIEAVEMDELADELAAATIPADPDVKNYSYTLVKNKVYYRENSIMKPVDMSESMQERIKGMVGIRNCTQELINLQLEEYPDTVIKEKQRELNTLYDTFSRKYGLINSQTNKRAFNQDNSYCLLCSLESWMMRAISKAKRICSRNVPLRKRKWLQAWIQQRRLWRYLYQKKQRLTFLIWRS